MIITLFFFVGMHVLPYAAMHCLMCFTCYSVTLDLVFVKLQFNDIFEVISCLLNILA
jgi:hypothetical protein